MSKVAQAEFFDKAFGEGTRGQATSFYAIARSIRETYRAYLARLAPGARVLEYGCGAGSFAFFVGEQGAAQVVGIDLSPVGIEQAQQRAADRGLSNLRFAVMDAEHLDFEEGCFDLVCGTGILHHLDLDQAMGEVCRVLRPEGSAIFIEPMGHNPAINLFRRLTPGLRVEDEYPLKRPDLDQIGLHFEKARFEFYYLLTLLAIPFRRSQRIVTAFDSLDRKLLAGLPFLRLWAWQVLIILERPRKDGPLVRI